MILIRLDLCSLFWARAFSQSNALAGCAKRRTRTELEKTFPAWNFQDLQAEHYHLWTPQMEDVQDAAERGYQGLCWMMDRPEDSILLVCHGGILRYMMNQHPLIALKDERTSCDKAVESRFDNCEVRRYILSWNEEDKPLTSHCERILQSMETDDPYFSLK
jgi:broad specificity phosphatase PhoE